MDELDSPLMGFFLGLMVAGILLAGLHWDSRKTQQTKEICIEHCQNLCKDLVSTMKAQTDG